MNLLRRIDAGVALAPLLIFSIGAVTLLSTSSDRVTNQLFFFSFGLALYILAALIDYEFYKHYWFVAYGVVVALLALTYLAGHVVGGAARWLNLSLFTIQPSEFAKVAVVIFTASLISTLKRRSLNPTFLVRLTALFLPVLFLVVVQPDLGTAIILLLIFVGILFYAGVNKIYFVLAFVVLGLFSSPIWANLHDYQKERIIVFLNPTLDVAGSGYNVIQSTIAIGSGGLLGRGFGHGTQTHLQFLPVYWTDFIFAAFAEEWGLVGVVCILVFYAALLVSVLRISFKVESSFGSLLCAGVFILFFSQFGINVGMNLGILPVTGIPLPLVSYGGSSLVTSLFLLGLVQSVWIHRRGR
ncbi:MAG: Rod shape-determining protein RodA [candidate division WWE3 bacterium GW2011_GWA1_46_21]|uniref:Rod shape-determining protein RodA n=3 Tax=Katanobacteria TaxID=422282 RepID=A0A0G1PCV3_UNCKA|nr:MAG: Rod shape-determining protein RodA [candidate division WWE3 bacterium GW2011_GWA1_46_21]KKU49242.1 MAG: Rod shape-determining protein RodA [candidate division WWE3 bacterium GW2011_GWA2_46_9]KKU50617.1 MAG: Rod shape-determining protein RodA [candidate division WWE3 bacterium GW2011_GWC1_47_10]